MATKPKLTTILVKQSYWACSIASHRHTREDVAAKCCEDNDMMLMRKAEREKSRWRAQDDAAVMEAYRLGSTQVDIANAMGVSTFRIGQVIEKANRREMLGAIRAKSSIAGDLVENGRSVLYVVFAAQSIAESK